MKPYESIRGIRRKRDHKIKCLKCQQPFLSISLKSNRICAKCKAATDWSDYSPFEPD